MKRVRIPIRTLAAAAVATSMLGTAGGALAATDPATTATPPPGLTFVPPAVGPICVNLGAIVIGGKVISPSLHVCTQGVTVPPIVWRPFLRTTT